MELSAWVWDLLFGGPECVQQAFWWVPLLIMTAATIGAQAHQTNIAKKDAKSQQQQAERQMAQQAKEAEELAAAARAPKAPKQQAQRKQAVPEYSEQASLEQLSIRGRRGTSALRVPKTGTGLRIPT
jgi:hemolysin activation/secretion protein